MPEALILSTGYEPEYLRIVEQIAQNSIKNGINPVILDLAPIMLSPTETYSPAILALGGLENPGKKFTYRFESLNIAVVSAKSFVFTDTVNDSEALEVLKESTQSALLTYFRTDELDFSKSRVRRIEKNLLIEGSRSFNILTEYLTNNHPLISYVPNGRFPVQRMAKFALRQADIDVHHFEKGATRDHAFFRPYSPHDRVATQLDVDNVLTGIPPKKINEVATRWLESRLPSLSSSNEYSAIWSQQESGETRKDESHKTIGFFTSSQDEFLHLGPDWQLHTWESQFEAFDSLMTYFEERGFTCFLRIHPNLSTKDHACFKREVRGLKKLVSEHPKLEVYWHDNPTSSYKLLEKCSGVVVWDSTIGLEASAQGIPVWNCAASYYGMVADTRQVLGFENMSDKNLSLWEVDHEKAKRFISATVLRDLPLSTQASDWVDWDLSRPPFLVRVSTFIRSGGAPTFTDSVFATLDPWRHRSLTVNRKLLSAKLKRLFA